MLWLWSTFTVMLVIAEVVWRPPGARPRDSADQPNPDEHDRDPVCGMDLDVENAIASCKYEGRMYAFCSPKCRRAFEKDPVRYAKGRVRS